MIKAISFNIFLTGLIFILAGCKPSQVASQATPANHSGYFQTDFQNESQFIVETIVTDLAEQIYYAKFHQLPDKTYFKVSASETGNSTFGEPIYDLALDLDAKYRGLKTRLKVNGPIWAPEVYADLTSKLSQLVGLSHGENNGQTSTVLLAQLTDGTASTIEQENQALSEALAKNFCDGWQHEKAAVLLGAFALREHSGDFCEIRSPLCRITTHLAMARFLDGEEISAINGRMAEAILDTLMNNEAAALEELSEIKTNDPAVASWVRALQARNTRDYRPLDKIDGLTQIECINWFYALASSVNGDIAWSKLSETQKQIPDFVRIANAGSYSVEMGHELLAHSIPLEFREFGSIYEMSRKKKLGKEEILPALNQMPERCLSTGTDGQTEVQVIGWGLWAGFFQRQLCHAVQHNYDFMQRIWGVPDDAKSFAERCDKMFGGLRLYPFVRRFDCTDVESYHKAVDDGLKVTVESPQAVPAQCWNYLCYDYSSTERYRPNPNPHLNEWHNHNPPPGTAYDPAPRMDQPSFANRPFTGALLLKLRELAPYDSDIAYHMLWKYGGSNPAYSLVTNIYQPVLAYANYAVVTEAQTPEVWDDPERYEQLLSRAAEFDLKDYFRLGDYFAARGMDDKAATYYEKGNTASDDSLDGAACAGWLVKYYLRKGETEKARMVADNAGEAYSYVGLLAKAEFLEATGDPSGAFEWYANIEERYDDPGPVTAFCARYKAKTKDTRFDGELQRSMFKLFPLGTEKVSMDDFKSPPKDGVMFADESELLRSAGLRAGDVIVAVYGIRMHNVAQYNYGRQIGKNAELDLIVWKPQERIYREIKSSPPGRLFGVGLTQYEQP